jgi:hypothetical protein
MDTLKVNPFTSIHFIYSSLLRLAKIVLISMQAMKEIRGVEV